MYFCLFVTLFNIHSHTYYRQLIGLILEFFFRESFRKRKTKIFVRFVPTPLTNKLCGQGFAILLVDRRKACFGSNYSIVQEHR